MCVRAQVLKQQLMKEKATGLKESFKGYTGGLDGRKEREKMS